MSGQTALDQFLEFFEWAYDIRFTPHQKEDITQDVALGWKNADLSERELVQYVMDRHKDVLGGGHERNRNLQDAARAIFNSEFSRFENNDRTRVLQTIHRAIEESAPGVTEVLVAPLSRRGTASRRSSIKSSATGPVQHQTRHPVSSKFATQPPLNAGTSASSVDPYQTKLNDIQQEMMRRQEQKLEIEYEVNKHTLWAQTMKHIIDNIR
ncbi:MAG: hypothetical protein H0X01_01800 [Nitrospira sp.]|nr:hypothetical protein [Nitrospira sp.]